MRLIKVVTFILRDFLSKGETRDKHPGLKVTLDKSFAYCLSLSFFSPINVVLIDRLECFFSLFYSLN